LSGEPHGFSRTGSIALLGQFRCLGIEILHSAICDWNVPLAKIP